MKNLTFRLAILSILFATILVFNSCGTSAMQETSIDFKEHTATAGRVVGSVTFVNTKPKYEGYRVAFTSTSTDKKIARKNYNSINFSTDQMPKAFTGELERGQTYLFTCPMEIGDYNASSIVFIYSSGTYINYLTYSGFSIPFNVQKGKITYIGNIVVDESKMGQESFITLKNSYARDINAIRRTYPEVIWTRALNDTTRKIEYKKMDIVKDTVQ